MLTLLYFQANVTDVRATVPLSVLALSVLVVAIPHWDIILLLHFTSLSGMLAHCHNLLAIINAISNTCALPTMTGQILL